MKTLLIIFAMLSVSAFAQTLSLACPASVRVGTALTCQVSIVNDQGSAGIQFTATSTPSLGTLTAQSAGSAAGALKGIAIASPSVLIDGFGPPAPGTLNAGLFPDGLLATLTWQVPASLANQNISITLAGGALPAEATSATGSLIAVTAGPQSAVSVLPSISLCDLDGNGVTDQADVTAQLGMIMTFPHSAKCARDATGCGVTALQVVVNAALGGKCTATQ